MNTAKTPYSGRHEGGDRSSKLMSVEFDERERRLAVALLDRLIPPVDTLPGAGAMGLAAEVERMAGAHPRFAKAITRCLAALPAGLADLSGEQQDDATRAIEASRPGDFALMLEAVYIAYYTRPEVHKRIGWRSGPLQPAGFALPPFDEAILDTVRRRKPFWRQAPE